VTQLPEVPPTLPLDKPQPKRAYVNEGAPPAAGDKPTGTDKNYVVHTFSLPIKELNDAFVTANVPPEAMTSVVSIKLMRQELGQDGVTWGAATEVKRLNNATNVNANPIPPATATPEEVAKFLNWAAQPQSQTDIIRPAFYTIILGQGPWDPSAAVVAAANEDAEKQRLEEIRKAKREENLRKAAEDSKRRAEEARQRASQQQEPKEARPRRERSRLVDDPARPADYAGLAGMQLAQANSDAPPDFMNVPQPDPNNPAPGGPGAAPGVDALPAPAFLPSAGPATAKGWAYDDAVEEGHTYRYQVIWVIKNPVYLAGRNVIDPKHPELAQIVTISSKLDDNKWSDEVTIPTSTEYFLAGNNWQANVPAKIGIVVFKNTGGKWIDAKEEVWPGDRIGKTNGTGSFETNSVLVDIRYDPRASGGNGRAYALVLGPDGQLTERDPLKDRNDPRRKALEELVKQGTPAAGAAGAPAASATPSPMPGM
jgi:hypothetical protein